MSVVLSRVLRLRWWLTCAFLLVVAVVAGHDRHIDERLWFWLHEIQVPASEQHSSVWLPGYKAVLQAKEIAGLEDDELSGLTYSPQTNTLFTVTGKYPQLVELSLSGEVLRRIELHGLANPEGVEMISGGRLAVIDERQHTLTTFKITELTRSLEAADNPSYELGFADAGNKGFEGIAWDPVHNRVLLGKERDPMGLFSLPFPGEEGGPGALEALPSSKLFLRDISSLTYDVRTGHSLVLSDESRLLLEVDAAGEPISFISLGRGMNGLSAAIAQPEGVTMDAEGNIYIVAEPNLFYVLHKDPEAAPAP
jgi:uncharacterized protein YjiK